ncbi:MAG: DUF975 family protein [Eubacteriaceae bacterium]|nr:DUF975 family protein [Eubacteriaceae bacterium]
MEIITNRQIRENARIILKGKKIDTLAVLVIGFFIAASVSFLDGYFQLMKEMVGGNYPNLSSLASMQTLLLGGPVTFGTAYFFLRIARKNEPEISNVFLGFRKYGTTFLCYFIQNLFIILWMILLIIPGIIAAISYSMSFYLLVDYPMLGAMDALSFSKELMKGHKGRFFLLLLSFIGWFLLGVITLGIAYLYVIPYQNASMSVFYDNLIQAADPDLINKYIEQ